MIDRRIREKINEKLLARGGCWAHPETIRRNLRLIEMVRKKWPELADLLDEGVVDFDPETAMLWTDGANPVLLMRRSWGVEFLSCEYNHEDGKFHPAWHCEDPWSAFYYSIRHYRDGKTPFAFPPNIPEGTT